MLSRLLISALVLLAVLAVPAQAQRHTPITDFGESEYDPYLGSLTDTTPDTLAWTDKPQAWLRLYSYDEDLFVLMNRCYYFSNACGTVDTADTLRIPAGIPWAFTPLCDSLVVGVYDGSGSTAYTVESQPYRP